MYVPSSAAFSVTKRATILIFTMLVYACGGGSNSGTSHTQASDSDFRTSANPRAISSPVPIPEVVGPIPYDVGIKGRPAGLSLAHLAPVEVYDYVEEEYFISGMAQERDEDGVLTGGVAASYTSRILVRRPKNSDAFNGTVLLEWYNNTGQSDSDVVWTTSHDMLMREGFVHVGVSAQQAGVSGVSPLALKNWDLIRYAELNHPGDSYAWDIFAQAGRALFSLDTSPVVLKNLRPDRMIAAGESQSSFKLVAYSDVIQREHVLFDGFFLHTGPVAGKGVDDVGVPILHLITETEIDGILALELGGAVLDYATPITNLVLPSSPPPYGPDRGLIRVWEVAGGSHFDKQLWAYTTAFLVREASSPLDLPIYIEQPVFCGLPLNELGQGRVSAAALHHLNIWVETGKAPVSRPRIELDDNFRIVRDADGLAQGGIQLPPMAAPIGVNRGDECVFWGSFQPFLPSEVLARYPTHQTYIDAVSTAAMNNVEEGDLLPEEALLYIEEAKARKLYWFGE